MGELDLEALRRRPVTTITVLGRPDGVGFVLISPEERDDAVCQWIWQRVIESLR